jgi:hypothetical protein
MSPRVVAADQQDTGAAVGQAASQASGHWKALRAATDLQFAPVRPQPPLPPHPVPEWLQGLGRLLEFIFKPLAQALGIAWPVTQWLVIGAAAAVLALLAWRLGAWLWGKARAQMPALAADWAPDRAEASALLEDADRLAQQGRYDEAAHLLLRRSCDQIRAAHPDWLHPASTAREIAALPALPGPARTAFAVIADRVEASRYALRTLIEADWQAARAAYAQFALHGPETA